MLFSYNWLQGFFSKKLPKVQKLADLIVLHSFEVDEVRKVGKDWLLDIDVRPNRVSDCFSHLGMAQEIGTILNYKVKEIKPKIKEDKKQKVKDFVSIDVKNKKDCLRYTARVMTDIKVKPSPQWLKKRLELLGLQSINNIVDSLNYVMLELGQPLHAFDLEKITNQKLIIRKAKKGERITSLDNQKYKLDKEILTINDGQGPLAIAGIKGGEKARINKETKKIVIESANFDPVLIRKVSKKIDLKTDASWIFEHGIDPNLTEKAINRAVELIQELSKGKAISKTLDFYPQKRLPRVIGLKVEKVNSLLGLNISQKEMIKILKRANFKILDKMKGAIKVEIPTSRLDVKLPADLIEEIGRLYGYQNIPEEFPTGELSFPEKNPNIFWGDKVKDILKELGFSEIYNYSFINPEQANLFNYSEKDLISTKNPISAEYQYLRPSLIPNLIENVKVQLKDFDSFKTFELGKVFKKTKERRDLSGLIVGDQKEYFYELKGLIDNLFEKVGVTDYYFDNYQATPEESNINIWDIERAAEIKINNKEIGFLGYISKEILKKMGIKKDVIVFDINFDLLQKLMTEENEYQPISPYPTAVRDLSILVPHQVKVVEVLNIINRIGKELVVDVDLFDIYNEFSKNQKSLAFHIIYQSQEKTLSSKEIDRLHNKIVKKLEKNINWEVRK